MTNVIMYDSEEAAQEKTVTGWFSRDGYFYGDDEHLARWRGCTHLKCECGNTYEKGYTMCQECASKPRQERYLAMPFKEWDGVTPLTLYDDDKYFFDEDSIICYCEDEGVAPSNLRLVICEPNYAHEIDPNDYYCDELPEDQYVHDIFPELAAAIEAVNKVIQENKTPLSWGGGKYRTTVNIEMPPEE